MVAFAAPDELWLKLEEVAATISGPRGTFLFRRGDAVTGVYLLREGAIRLSLGPDGPRLLMRNLGPGSILGLPGTLSGKTYSLSAEIVENAELGFVNRETLMELLRETPNLCFQVMDILSQEISAMRAMVRPRTRVRRTHKPV